MESTDRDTRTPLLVASLAASLKCVSLLLRRGAAVNVADATGQTPLHALVGSACRALRQKRNVDVNPHEARDEKNIFEEPDDSSRYVSTVQEMLSKGALVASHEEYLGTPLHIACRWNHDDIVALLVQYQPDVDAIDRDGRYVISCM